MASGQWPVASGHDDADYDDDGWGSAPISGANINAVKTMQSPCAQANANDEKETRHGTNIAVM